MNLYGDCIEMCVSCTLIKISSSIKLAFPTEVAKSQVAIE